MNTLTTRKKHDIIKKAWIITALALATSVPVAAHPEDHAAADTGMISDPAVPLLRTPAAFKPHRQTAFREL